MQSAIDDLLKRVLGFVPQAVGALVLLLVAWVVATLIRAGLRRGLKALRVDEKWSGSSKTPLSKTLSDLGYGIAWLLFLPAIVERLGVGGLLAPLQNLSGKLLGFLPNLLGAGIILFVGFILARVIRQVLTGILSATGVDGLSARIGLSKALGEHRLSDLIGTVAHALILLPVVVAGLQALKLDAVTTPATAMLSKVLDGIPNLFGAAITLIIAYVIGKLVAGVIAGVLEGIGFNELPAKMGLTAPTQEGEGVRKPSEIAGTVALIGAMVFATIEASRMLGLTLFAGMVTNLTTIAGQVLSGVVVLAIGLYLANVVANLVRSSGVASAEKLALLARIAILVLTAAMGLRQMGVAADIINMTFGLTLGAVAVAAAIAFGIGGRETAGRLFAKWVETLEKK